MTESNAPRAAVDGDSGRVMALVAYVLFLIGWPTLHLATIGGVVLAYVQRTDSRGTIWESHFDAIIKTFWISLVVGVIAIPLCFVVVGFGVLGILVIWFLYRTIRGLVHAIDSKPY